jgi:hypothetical protein
MVYLAIWDMALSRRLFPGTKALIQKVTLLILEMLKFNDQNG